jgi:hypothetical protein
MMKVVVIPSGIEGYVSTVVDHVRNHLPHLLHDPLVRRGEHAHHHEVYDEQQSIDSSKELMFSRLCQLIELGAETEEVVHGHGIGGQQEWNPPHYGSTRTSWAT